jgi:DHA1 family bicyclomycin/chloramphenicol resistance-like MFS transporter
MEYQRMRGTVSTADIVAPIAGLGGSDTAVPMALLMIGGALLSLFGLLVLARPHANRAGR